MSGVVSFQVWMDSGESRPIWYRINSENETRQLGDEEQAYETLGSLIDRLYKERHRKLTEDRDKAIEQLAKAQANLEA